MIAILISIVLGGLRIAGVKSVVFQALAHCWVGGLVGVWWFSLRHDHMWVTSAKSAESETTRCGWLALALTALEVACFVWFKYFAGA